MNFYDPIIRNIVMGIPKYVYVFTGGLSILMHCVIFLPDAMSIKTQ